MRPSSLLIVALAIAATAPVAGNAAPRTCATPVFMVVPVTRSAVTACEMNLPAGARFLTLSWSADANAIVSLHTYDAEDRRRSMTCTLRAGLPRGCSEYGIDGFAVHTRDLGGGDAQGVISPTSALRAFLDVRAYSYTCIASSCPGLGTGTFELQTSEM